MMNLLLYTVVLLLIFSSSFFWFSVLSTAGIRGGLVFYGVTEPLSHLDDPSTVLPPTPLADDESILDASFFWGLDPRLIYHVATLARIFFCLGLNELAF